MSIVKSEKPADRKKPVKPKYSGQKKVRKDDAYKVKSGKGLKFKKKRDTKERKEKSADGPKANLKRKLENKDSKDDEKKLKLFQMKKKERKLIRKKKDRTEKFERSKRLKAISEELRRDNIEKEKKTKLLEESIKLIKGHAKELIYAHDTGRVLEWVFNLGTCSQRAVLFEELKDSIPLLVKSKYGKFFLITVLRHGSKEQKNEIIKAFYSNVIQLISHSEAADVVEFAFNESASSLQRRLLVQEFYGPAYKYFKDTGLSLQQLLKENPEKKSSVIQYMKGAIMKFIEKKVIRHSIAHFVLREFLINADQQSRLEVIEVLYPAIVDILHTKDGARASMYCIWHGSSKIRKAIVKSFKTHVSKIAQEEFGHMVLLAIFDSVDDTRLIDKHIISELVKDILQISQSGYGRKVLLYLLHARDSLYFSPPVIEILQEGDNNETSKKEPQTRRLELKEYIKPHLVQLVIDHISEFYQDNSFCLMTFTILKHSIGNRVKAFESVAKLVATEYSANSKNMHIIEAQGSAFLLKKLLLEEKSYESSEDQACFSKVLIDLATKEVMTSWTDCNRGCFLLVSLLETEIPSVTSTIKDAFQGYHQKLSKKSFRGAEILLTKLKQLK